MTEQSAFPKGPLNGVRVVDFTWKAVGPWSVRLLAPYGAEIIHIERADVPDDHRFDFRESLIGNQQKVWHDGEDGRPYYTAPYYNVLHNGKLAVSLNARHPEGLRLIERLIEVSDAVVENFSAGVLESWGLGWERLNELNPGIVYLSVSGFGHSGDLKDYRSYGPTAQAQGGLTHAAGLPDREPGGWGYSHMDIAGGWIGGLGLALGLLNAKRFGRGAYIDYAVTEATMSLLGTYFLDYQVNGRTTRRDGFPPGNRSEWPAIAPHNTYRCAGEDRVGQGCWVFIACESQRQFESLCQLMDRSDLVLDPRFSAMSGRVKHQDELDAIIGEWTAPRRRFEIMEMCQDVGVIAAVVQNAEDRVEVDPQLRHRDMYPVIDHPEIGEFPIERYPVRLSKTPAFSSVGRAPMVREHERYVLQDVLGLDDEQVLLFREQGVI